MRFERNPDRVVREVMTPLDNLVTCPPETDLDEAKRLMQMHKIEKLLIVGDQGDLKGLITFKDLQATDAAPQRCT